MAAAGALAGAGQAASGLSGLIGGTSAGSGRSFISPDQLPFLKDIFQRAQDFSNQSGFAGQDPLQSEGQNNALLAASGLSPLINGAQSANQFLLGDVLNPASNPFLQSTASAATRPIFEGLTQNILPAIRGGAAGTGNVGSSRQGIAEGLASQGALRSAGDASSSIFSNAYGQGLGALVQGLGLAPQTAQLGLLPSNIQQQIGGQRRQLSQEEMFAPFEQLQRFKELTGPPILQNEQQQESGSGLSGLFSGSDFGGSGGLGATILSGGLNKLFGF